MFINQTITRNGVVVSTGVTKMVFKALNGKTLPPREVFQQLGYDVSDAASGSDAGSNGVAGADHTGAVKRTATAAKMNGSHSTASNGGDAAPLPVALEGGRTFLAVDERVPSLRNTAVDGWMYMERALQLLQVTGGKNSKL